MRTVIAFDVSGEKRRYRVVKALLDRSVRVQKSVFEATELDDAVFLRLRSDLEGLIDRETDSLRYWRLCRACGRRVVQVGVMPGALDDTESFRIIG